MPRHVSKLQCQNMLGAALRLQRNRKLPEDQAQSGAKAEHRQKAHASRKQRCQPGCHRGRAGQHRPDGAHLPGGITRLLQEERQHGPVRHRGPGVRAAQSGFDTVGEAQLPQVVS